MTSAKFAKNWQFAVCGSEANVKVKLEVGKAFFLPPAEN